MASRLKAYRFRNTYGGVNKELSAEVIPDNAATQTDNWVLRSKGLETIKGWIKFTDQVLNDGEASPANLTVLRIDQYFKDDGSNYLVAFTNWRVYYFEEASSDLWIPITQGASPVSTTLTAGEAAGNTNLDVADTTGFTVGAVVVVGLGTSNVEYMVIDAINAGAPGDMDVSRPSWAPSGTGLQNTHAASARVDQIESQVFAAEASDFDSDITENTYYFTDGVNAVQSWDATGTPTFSANLGGLESGDDVEGLGTLSADLKAKYIKAFESFLVIGHLTEEGTIVPQKIRWSKRNTYDEWVNDADGTGQAGAFLFTGPDFITGMFQLKRELLIYRERSIEAMSYIGPPNIFAFRRAETGTGLLSHDALVDLGDRHIFIGPDDFYSYNGISLASIGDGAITRDFFDKLDPSQRSTVQAFFIEEESEVWFAYSTTGNRVADKAYVYNVVFNKWSGPRDVDSTAFGYYDQQSSTTWNSATGTWDGSPDTWDSRVFLANSPINLMGNDDGLIFTVDTGQTENGSTITSTYKSKITDCGLPEETKRLQRVRIGLKEQGSYTLNVRVGYATNAGDDMTWTTAQTISVDENVIPFIYADVTGRFFQVEVVATNTANIKDVELFFYPRVFR